jgi:hypothetical protein
MGRSITKKQLFVRNTTTSAAGLSSPVGASDGGTGITSYAIGDLIIASGATTLSKLASPAIGQFLLSGGVGAAPDYSGTNLTFEKATSTFSIKTTAGDEWFFVEPTNNTIALGDIDSSGNGSRLVIDNTNQKITWNKSIFGIGGVEYTFPAANASGVLTNNGSGTLSWAAASSGITVGTTTITSGTTGSIGMNIGGIYSESISYRAQQATPFSTAFGFESHSSGSFSGVNNTSFGYQAGKVLTTGTDNTFIGFQSGILTTTGVDNTIIGSTITGTSTAMTGCTVIGAKASATGGNYNTSIGRGAMRGSANKNNSISIGYEGGIYIGSNTLFIGNSIYDNGFGGNDYQIAIGNSNIPSHANTVIIGYGQSATGGTTATHQGILGSNNANGYISNWYFNGTSHTAPYSVALRACGGSGSNNVAANLNLYAGLSTGSGTPATVGFYSSAAGASSSSAQTAVKVFEITNSTTITTTDAVNYALGSTTGTKWGTATTQKQAFWNATPIVQPTTAYAAATLVGGAGTNITDTDTFDGYTLKQIVAALRGIGLLA